MKKKILLLAVIAIILSLGAYGTLAYFTYEETATNVITAGNVRVAVREWSVDGAGNRTPFADAINVLPGSTVSKTVEIENTGSGTAWVRISVEKAIELAAGVSGEADLSLVTWDLNTQDWTERDGWYYYHAALEPGQTTAPLFTQVQFALDMGNLYQGSTATVTVTVHAVQAAHNGETVFEAVGWPEAE